MLSLVKFYFGRIIKSRKVVQKMALFDAYIIT